MLSRFRHFLYCFASFDSRDFKFSATSDRKVPGCVAEFCAMQITYLQKGNNLSSLCSSVLSWAIMKRNKLKRASDLYSSQLQTIVSDQNLLAPVVRKPISANPRLNRPNRRNKFVLRLNSVPRSSISTIQRLN